MLKIVMLIALNIVSVFAMHTIELNINEKDLEIATKIDLGQTNNNIEPDTTFIGASYLKASEENSEDRSRYNLDLSEYFELNFLMKKEIRNSNFMLGIGLKANYTDLLDSSFFSVPLGLEAAYTLPTDSFLPMHIDAKLYYAPESLCFGDANSFFEFRINYAIEIIDRGFMIFGLRTIDTNLKINLNEVDVNYNRSGYFGFRFSF